jgi:hypothetical protein
MAICQSNGATLHAPAHPSPPLRSGRSHTQIMKHKNSKVQDPFVTAQPHHRPHLFCHSNSRSLRNRKQPRQQIAYVINPPPPSRLPVYQPTSPVGTNIKFHHTANQSLPNDFPMDSQRLFQPLSNHDPIIFLRTSDDFPVVFQGIQQRPSSLPALPRPARYDHTFLQHQLIIVQ